MIPQAAEEIKVPMKKMGTMMTVSVILAVLFYTMVVLSIGYIFNPLDICNSMQTTGLVTADAMAKAFNSSVMADVLVVGGLCGIVTSWNSFLIGGSRALYSMAESYMIPVKFAKLHDKYRSPVNALLLVGAFSVIAPFLGRTMLVWIVNVANFGCCLAYCMVALSFVVLRKKEPDMERPYRIKHYKVVGIIAVLMTGIMCAMYLIPGTGCTLIGEEWIIVGGWSALGLVFFIWSKMKYKKLFGSNID